MQRTSLRSTGFSPLLWVVVAAITGFAAVPATAQTTSPKNVLIFFIDDLRPELGCYGADQILSPSIDALAAEGVLFERAYCQQALCAPSRISMMTGQYPDNTGICGLFTPLRRVNKTALTMPQYFLGRGYQTSSFGKVYHHFRDDDSNWSNKPAKSPLKYADPETIAAIERRVAQAEKDNLSVADSRLAAKGPAIEIADVPDEAYVDGQVAQQAIDALRGKTGAPFFMCVGFAKPHLPFAAPKRYWDMYQADQFTVPQTNRPAGAPDLAFTKWNELRSYRDIPEEGLLSEESARELIHGYAASVSFADAQVGKVVAEVDRLGLRDETIIVLWGDHGYKLGDYGCWCKHTNLEIDARVPMIISAPSTKQPAVSNSLVEVVDIFPTLAALTGDDIPDSCDGQNLVPVLDDPSLAVRDFALSQYQRGSIMGYSLRNGRYRYTEWIEAKTQKVLATELYDHRDNQTPDQNLAGQPEHADLVADLSTRLNAAHRIKTTKVKMTK